MIGLPVPAVFWIFHFVVPCDLLYPSIHHLFIISLALYMVFVGAKTPVEPSLKRVK